MTKKKLIPPHTEEPPPTEAQSLNLIQKVLRHLQGHPDLVAVLHRMFESDRWFVTLSWMEVTDPEHPERDLQHYFKQQRFNPDDVVPTLRHLRDDWIKKCRPDMAIGSEEGFF